MHEDKKRPDPLCPITYKEAFLVGLGVAVGLAIFCFIMIGAFLLIG